MDHYIKNILRRSSAAGISLEVQKHQPSETSPEQLLGDDQPRTNSVWLSYAINTLYKFAKEARSISVFCHILAN